MQCLISFLFCVALVESLPPEITRPVQGGGAARHWVERLTGDAPDLLTYADGTPALKGGDQLWYLAGFPDEGLWDRIIEMAAQKVGLTLYPMPPGLRRRETATHDFLINYNAHSVEWNGHSIAACDVAITRRNPPGRG